MKKQQACHEYEDGIHRGLCGCGADVEQASLEVTPELIEEAAIAMYADYEVITVRQARRSYKWAALPQYSKDQYRDKAEFMLRWTLKRVGGKAKR